VFKGHEAQNVRYRIVVPDVKGDCEEGRLPRTPKELNKESLREVKRIDRGRGDDFICA
jgi:hypothetical protein